MWPHHSTEFYSPLPGNLATDLFSTEYAAHCHEETMGQQVFVVKRLGCQRRSDLAPTIACCPMSEDG